MNTLPSLSVRENLAGLSAMRNDQVGFLKRTVAAHGDIFKMRLGGLPVVMVSHPDYVDHVLSRNHENYDKENFLFRAAREIINDGIVANRGGEEWWQHRRILNPAFRRPNIQKFVTHMTDLTGEMLDEWEARSDSSSVVNVSSDADRLALKIVLRSLFGDASEESVRNFGDAFLDVNTISGNYFRFPFPPLSWRTPSRNRMRRRVKEMDDFISEILARRAAADSQAGDHAGEGATEPEGDLFDLMRSSTDEQTGSRLTEEELRNEVLSMIIGGFETSSTSIGWLYHQLADHPEIQRRVQDEVDQVLSGRVPTFADLPKLTYTRMVVDEALRLFAPAWQTMRRALDDDVIGGHRIPANTDVYINFFILHRHPEFWSEPERFDPERFTPEAVAARPRHAYQPFASGPRHCIGKHFGLSELLVATAMVAQRYHVEHPPVRTPVEMDPLLMLSPKDSINLRIRRR